VSSDPAGPTGSPPSSVGGRTGPRASARRRFVAWTAAIALLDLALAATLGIVRSSVWLLAAPSGVPAALAPLLTPLLLFVVVVEIVLLLAVEGRSLPARLQWLVAVQAALVALTPTVVAGTNLGLAVSLLGSGLIVAIFVLTFQYLYRNKQVEEATLSMLIGWPFAALLTAAGWFLWVFEGSPVVLGASVVAQLALALVFTVGRPLLPAGARVPWLLRPFAIFEFLLFAFLTEFFLGALLDLEIAGRTFLQFIPFVPYSGSTLHLAGVAAYNGLWFGAAILASAWFLVLLGFTMGPLVALKIRETHERAQKYRLALTIAAFAVAAVYIPSVASSTPLVSSSWLATIPILGWGFGLRSGGPFESGIFLAVVVMYAFVGVLTVLFGRKAVCSVMCGAALMYQGTAMSEMRGFNQTSKVGKYFLGSQLSTAYLVTSGVALSSLFAVSVLSLLHWIPTVQVASGALDTSALPLPIELYFGGVWFAMFVTTPFIGTYNCATTGFCHWGALTVPFAKVGFFRLKVKDKKVCQQCTTFDCAKACPVGLVDMPLHFRTKGEFRSTKCCGVGDCVGACPYGNMYHQDVRFWILRKLSRTDPRSNGVPGGGTPLPMVRPTANPAAAPPVRAKAEPAGDGTPA
jgi:polyferredoxin